MQKLKSILKAILPPVITSLFTKRTHPPYTGMWTGNYPTWQAATANSKGYNDNAILDKCKHALLKVKNGEAVYERDSVIFDKKQYSWPLLAALQNVALSQKKLCVLDFGGSLGSTYYQNVSFLAGIANLQWCVIEQPHFVDCGKQYFESDTLKFYPTITACLQQQQPNVLLLSSVLQYLESPYTSISELMALNIPDIIVDRTTFIADPSGTSRITLQTVPEDIYPASYPCWFFDETTFLNAFAPQYKLVADFNSYADPEKASDDGMQLYWKGFLLKLIK